MFNSAVKMVVSSGMSCCWFLFGDKFIVFIFFLIPQVNVRMPRRHFSKRGGGIYYLTAYNSSLGRGLDTKLSTCGN